MKKTLFSGIITLLLLSALTISAKDNISGPKLPPGFIKNMGQVRNADGSAIAGVLYSASSPEGAYLFYSDKVVFAPARSGGAAGAMLEMRFDNANAAVKVIGEEKSEAAFNYYTSDRKEPITSSMYAKVVYKNIYDGTDLVFYYSGGNCKYDFIAAAGADISKIKLRFAGQSSVELDKDGELEIKYLGGIWEHNAPSCFQQGKEVKSSYLLSGNTVSFKVDYDATKALTIDPVLKHATYFGGNGNEVVGKMKVDAGGNIFIASYTTSTNLPVTNPGGGAYYQSTYSYGPYYDAYIAKFSPSGALLWCTYYGTGAEANSFSLDVSPISGNIAICGYTSSTSFPVFNPGGTAYFNGTSFGPSSGYIVEFNNLGVRQWATLVGPSGWGGLNTVAYDLFGNIFVSATANGTYPVVNPGGGAYQQTYSGTDEAWIGKFNSGRSLTWATFYCGTGFGSYATDMACDAAGNVVMTGVTRDPSFPTYNPGGGAYYQGFFGGGSYDGFVAKFNNNGVRLWGTFLGGNGDENTEACSFDGAGNLYVAGNTASTNFPVLNRGGSSYYQGANPGTTTATLVKFNAGNKMIHSTYFGGNNYTSFNSIKVKNNSVYLAGTTNSTSLPVLNSFQNTPGGGYDIEVSKMDTQIVHQWTSYYGGAPDEGAYSITADNSQNVYVGGFSYGSTPTVNDGSFYYHSTFNGGSYDGFMMKIQDAVPAGALAFDGSNDYVDCGIIPTSLITIEAWVNANSLPTGVWKEVVARWDPFLMGNNLSYELDIQPGNQAALLISTDGTTFAQATGTTVLTTGAWYHLVGTFDGSNIRIYVNGVLEGTTPLSGTIFNSAAHVLVGATRSGAGPYSFNLNGTIDEVRIWNRALCQGEIQNSMSCEYSGPQSGLVAYYKCNQGFEGLNNAGVSTLTDLSGSGNNGTLQNFALTGATSNWVAGHVTGSCGVWTAPAATITPGGPTTFCAGGTVTLTANAGSGYSYQWSNGGTNIGGATAQTYTATTSGSYAVTVTVAGNCTATSASTVVVVNPLPVISSGGGVAICTGTSTNLSASGGASYSWMPSTGLSGTSGASVTASPVVSTTYTVTGSNSSGCSSNATVTVSVNSLPTVTLAASDVSCHGGSTGGVTTTVTGASPYSYSWSNGASVPGISGVSAGVYSVTVTDANLCSASASATVNEPTALTASSAISGSIACHGGSTTVTVSGSGGIAPYGTDAGTHTVAAGSYTYTVTDANGCSASTSITVGEPDVLAASSVAGTIACHGGSTTVTVNGSGGTAPYGTGAGTHTVAAGSYTYTVTDANGCSASTSITVGEPDALVASSVSGAIACHGGSTTVTVSGSGGTAPYGTDAGMHTVTAGSYTYTVTDANGCSASTSIAVGEPDALVASSVAGSIACHGGSTTVTVSGSGGTAPYGTDAGTHTVTAGSYTYTVTDANGCSANTSVTVGEPDALVASSVAGTIACHSGSTTVAVSGSGGTAPYSTDAGMHTVTAGSYTYTVTDANGCSANTSITVGEPAALVASSTATGSIACHGGSTTVAVSGSGGTTPYGTDAGTHTVAAGSYTYTVTDANGCSASTSITVSEPDVLAASSVAGSIACHGGSTTVTVRGSGGTVPYGTDAGTHTVAAGSYTYTVTDANGCSANTSITVGEPDALTASSVSGAIACHGGSTTVAVSGSGGTAPYGGYAGTHTVAAGSYTYTVTDANGCSANTSITVGEPDALVASSVAGSIACHGGSTTVTVSGSGGTAPYGGDAGTHLVTAGSYTYTVTDGHGCSAAVSVSIAEPSLLTASLAVSPVYPVPGYDAYTIYKGYGIQTETLTESAAGGTPGYHFSWSPTTGSTSSLTVYPPATTTYTVTVTDANGCTTASTQTINVIDVRCCAGHSDVCNKVNVCHHSHTLCIDSSDVADHLAAGDHLGACGTGARESSIDNNADNDAPGVVQVYPNPTSGIFFVKIPVEFHNATVAVFDVTGRIIQTRTLTNTVGQEEQFDLGSSARGLYIVKVTSGGSTDVVKLVLH